MIDAVHGHIEIVEAPGGPKARIAGHRIRVQDVVIWHERLGMSVDEIVDAYPTITMADVHAALAYYWDHRAEIDGAIAADRAFAEDFRRAHPGPLDEKLKRRRG